MGNGLPAEYDAFVRKAAACGHTAVHGCTPRDHMANLLRSGPWLEPDLRRLTEMVEGGVFAGSPQMAAEGIRICRRLVTELPNLPPPPAPPTQTPRPSRRFTGLIVRGALLFLGVAGLLALVVFAASRHRGSEVGRGGAPLLTAGGTPSPWTSDREKDSIRGLMDEWAAPPANPTFETVALPEYQDPAALSTAMGFSLRTGVDHHFENLAEPFDPPLNHHHRQFVFPWIDASLRMRQVFSPLRSAEVDAAPEGARVHRAEVRIRRVRGTAIQIPSPAPDSVVVSYDPIPGVRLKFVKDPADGMRVWSDTSGPYLLRYTTATVSDYLFAPLPDVPMSAVHLEPMGLPGPLRREAESVLARIGMPRDGTYRDRVRRLHAYFSGFTVSPLEWSERRGSAYQTLALARKGTCGHRSMTFVVTANAAGIPARLVANDVHAFPEVQLPNGDWRALELRILDGEKDPPPTTFRLTSDPGDVAVLLTAALLAFGLWTVSSRRSGVGVGTERSRRSRARRRAERDAARGMTSIVLLRLVRATMDRMYRHYGVEPGDRTGLRAVVRDDDIPPRQGLTIRALIDIDGSVRPDAPVDRYRLREAYWCARQVLEWLEKGNSP